MLLEKEEHRTILLAALRGLPVSGAAGDPEMWRIITAVRELLAAIEAATVADPPAAEETNVVALP